MRIDRLLVYLRFARTRSRACSLIKQGNIRINGSHMDRPSAPIKQGDIITFVHGESVRIIEILTVPTRRGPPGMARSHYRELDRDGKTALAAIFARELN